MWWEILDLNIINNTPNNHKEPFFGGPSVFFTVKILTLMPALRHLETASGTVERGGSIMDRSPTKHRLEVGKFMESVSNWKDSGNSFSGRYKWQKPGRIFRLV